MTSQVKPFTITYLRGSGRTAPIVDSLNEFKTFKAFIEAHSKSLTEADLRNVSLPFADLSGMLANNADFSGANLDGANLKEAVAASAKFTGARMRKMCLEDAALNDADFDDADIRGSDLSGAELGHASFRRTRANEVVLDSTELSSATLFNADFRGAHGVNTKLENARLANADFSFCFLVNPRMDGVHFDTQDYTTRTWSPERAADVNTLWANARIDGGSYDKIGHENMPSCIRKDSAATKFAHLAITGAAATALAVSGQDEIIRETSMAAAQHLAGGYTMAVGVGATLVAFTLRDKIWDRAKEFTGGILGRLAGLVHEQREKRLPVERAQAKKQFDALKVLVASDPVSAQRLTKAFAAVQVKWYSGDTSKAAQDLTPDKSFGARVFLCKDKDVVRAMAELAKMSKGQIWGRSVIVNPAALMDKDSSYPAVIKSDAGQLHVAYVSRSKRDTLDTWLTGIYSAGTGQLLGARIQRLNRMETIEASDPRLQRLQLPAMFDAIDAMRRDTGLNERIDLHNKNKAADYMKVPDGSHAISKESVKGRAAFVCRTITSSGERGVIDNPNGPAILTEDGEELFVSHGRRKRTPPGVLREQDFKDSLALLPRQGP